MVKSSHEEIEFVYTDIDVDDIRKLLEEAGAEFIFDETYDIVVFDYPDLRLNDDGAWIKLRQIEGKETTLSFKRRIRANDDHRGFNDTGMQEIEFEVSDFQKVYDFFVAMGMMTKKQQEKRRVRYMLDGVEFDIDYWPLIKPYLEVEGNSEEEIDRAVAKVGLDPEEKRQINGWFIYKEQGINLHDYKVLTFDHQEMQDNGGRGTENDGK